MSLDKSYLDNLYGVVSLMTGCWMARCLNQQDHRGTKVRALRLLFHSRLLMVTHSDYICRYIHLHLAVQYFTVPLQP
jgi:hypothetical protein